MQERDVFTNICWISLPQTSVFRFMICREFEVFLFWSPAAGDHVIYGRPVNGTVVAHVEVPIAWRPRIIDTIVATHTPDSITHFPLFVFALRRVFPLSTPPMDPPYPGLATSSPLYCVVTQVQLRCSRLFLRVRIPVCLVCIVNKRGSSNRVGPFSLASPHLSDSGKRKIVPRRWLTQGFIKDLKHFSSERWENVELEVSLLLNKGPKLEKPHIILTSDQD
ncbi:hypothetical protein TNCV_1698131 [Trichonephila clavipes]|nr:hypothetical protein TNCV_1698131 [Trichonephila clavipes]